MEHRIANDPNIGLQAQTKEEMAGLRQERLKAYADSFEATAKAWYYLDGGANRGDARYPGGMKRTDWDRRVKQLADTLKARTAVEIGIPNDKFEAMYIDNGDFLHDYMMLEFKKSMAAGELFDPAMITRRAEKLLAEDLGIKLPERKIAKAE